MAKALEKEASRVGEAAIECRCPGRRILPVEVGAE